MDTNMMAWFFLTHSVVTAAVEALITQETDIKLTKSCQSTGNIDAVLVRCSPMTKMQTRRLTMHVNTMSRICHANGRLR